MELAKNSKCIGIFIAVSFVYLHMILGIISICTFKFEQKSPYDRANEVEGDMILTNEQKRNNFTERVGLIDKKFLWPNNKVLFDIDDSIAGNDALKILSTINELNQKFANCINFEWRQNKNDPRPFVLIGDGNGCSSYVGYQGKQQKVNLGKGCIHHGIIAHELFHTLGLYHMHTAYNKDKYIKINYENMRKECYYNFNKVANDTAVFYDLPYDYGSVMHYGRYLFSKNGKPTIEPLDKDAVIGKNRISDLDIRRIKRMYKCS